MPKNKHHVVPNAARGGWDVKRYGAERASAHTEKKADAVKIGRELSRNASSELVIHGKYGPSSKRIVTEAILVHPAIEIKSDHTYSRRVSAAVSISKNLIL